MMPVQNIDSAVEEGLCEPTKRLVDETEQG